MNRKETGICDPFTDGLMGWSYGSVRGFPTVTRTWHEEFVSQRVIVVIGQLKIHRLEWMIYSASVLDVYEGCWLSEGTKRK